ncbi:Dynamin 4C-like protein [Quillaja saponaria]|uniref:Dynamin 4C-like protein n=1 Tax=Quillaja saponaria TaxID=32244 RepID=A0AAD7PUW2_QUISA|nr:Dynamin 4C-like protein [Quillaja saponaria]
MANVGIQHHNDRGPSNGSIFFCNFWVRNTFLGKARLNMFASSQELDNYFNILIMHYGVLDQNLVPAYICHRYPHCFYISPTEIPWQIVSMCLTDVHAVSPNLLPSNPFQSVNLVRNFSLGGIGEVVDQNFANVIQNQPQQPFAPVLDGLNQLGPLGGDGSLMRIIGLAKESLRKILLTGEFNEYPDEKSMHCTARVGEMFDYYSTQLHQCAESDPSKDFLIEEIAVLEEAKWIGLPNFLSRASFFTILQRKVKEISAMPIGFVEDIWNYIEDVVFSVLCRHSENCDQLQMSIRSAGQSLIAKMKAKSIDRVMELVEMEKLTDYTCIGQVDVVVLRQYPHLLKQSFELKMRVTAYWQIVLNRLIDGTALHFQHSIKHLVNKDLEVEIVKKLLGTQGFGIEESPSVAVAVKREKVKRSTTKAREAKEVMCNPCCNNLLQQQPDFLQQEELGEKHALHQLPEAQVQPQQQQEEEVTDYFPDIESTDSEDTKDTTEYEVQGQCFGLVRIVL